MKRFIGFAAAALFLLAVFLFFRFGEAGTALLWSFSSEGTWLLPLVSVSALLDSVNPCAFSVLLLTVAFLFSLGAARENILKIGMFYILGIFAAYLLIGFGLLQALHIFNTPHFMGRVGAALLVGLGLINLAGYFFPSFPVRFGIPRAAHQKMGELMKKASLPSAFLLGGLVGLCEFPCTGGPYLMVLGLLRDQKTYLSGVGYLLLYNLIFVMPMLFMLFFSSNKLLFEKVQAWKKKETKNMRLWGSVAMVALGIIIFVL
ncbi:MAG: hypothetical protein HYV77_01820 [Candidatus Wildermuthbacteria bacterium]|nr:hypothetical protein [Candidatus Wildermuthbacteria bacterium]